MRYDASGRDRVQPDPVNTQISIAFENRTSYIAPILFPQVRTRLQSGRYEIFGREFFTEHFGQTVRAPGARAPEVEGRRVVAEDTYFAREHALEELTPDEEITENPGESPEADSVEDLTNRLLLAKELRARDLLYNPASYYNDHVFSLGAGEHFDDFGTSNPIELFRDLHRTFYKTLGVVPNVAVIPWTAMSYLEDHPAIIARYAALGGVITPEQIANVLGLRRIIVPGGSYNNENPGQAAALSEIWGNNIVMGLIPNRAARRTPALGYEFLWPIAGARGTEDSVSTDRRRDNDRIGWINRVRRRYDLKLVGRDPDLPGNPVVAGMLLQNIVSPDNA